MLLFPPYQNWKKKKKKFKNLLNPKIRPPPPSTSKIDWYQHCLSRDLFHFLSEKNVTTSRSLYILYKSIESHVNSSSVPGMDTKPNAAKWPSTVQPNWFVIEFEKYQDKKTLLTIE